MNRPRRPVFAAAVIVAAAAVAACSPPSEEKSVAAVPLAAAAADAGATGPGVSTSVPRPTTTPPPAPTSTQPPPQSLGVVPSLPDLEVFVKPSTVAHDRLFDVVDTSARVKALNVASRTIHVRIFTPLDTPIESVRVIGAYHDGGVPYAGARYEAAPPVREAVIAVAFAAIDAETPDYWDVWNAPGDVSAVLDILEVRTDLAGAIPLDRVWYYGSSMAAIVGWQFANDCCAEGRFDGLLLRAGYRLDDLVGFDGNYNFAAAPPILASHGTDDPTLPYELFRRAASVEVDADTTFVSVFEGGHGDFDECGAYALFERDWINYAVFDGPAPVLGSDPCTVVGVVAGGTTGFGAVSPFVAR
jgi:hypothetical protein